MNMHDKMAKELFDNKSLKALSYLIEHGRELELEYDKKYVSLVKIIRAGLYLYGLKRKNSILTAWNN
jgi:hypothetical protein